MWSTCESGIENYASVQSYGQNKKCYENVSKNGQFPFYFSLTLEMGGHFHGCGNKSFLFDILCAFVLS